MTEFFSAFGIKGKGLYFQMASLGTSKYFIISIIYIGMVQEVESEIQ